MLKNVFALVIGGGVTLALVTGWLSPDRPTRDDWEKIERARQVKSGQVVYRSNFATETPGQPRNPAGYWGYYNGATASTVQFEPAGVTVKYGGVAWIGAEFRFTGYVPKRVYRIILERHVEGEPGALIVRNRQLDLVRVRIPVGSGPFQTEFLAPQGSLDKVVLAFIADGRDKPQGRMRIDSLVIEQLGE